MAAQLERCDKENKILKDEMNKEIEAVPLPCHASLSHPLPWLSLSFAFTLPAVDSRDVCCRAGPLYRVRALSFLSRLLYCAASLSPFPFWFSSFSSFLKNKSLKSKDMPGLRPTCCILCGVYFVPTKNVPPVLFSKGPYSPRDSSAGLLEAQGSS